MRVSYSALNTYKTCPLKFKLQVLDKIKTPKSIEAVFGTLVHSALNKMFKRTPLYPSLDEIINHFSEKWLEATTTYEDDVVKLLFEDGVKLLKNFHKKNPPWNFNTVELESYFNVEIEDPKNNESHTLAGIMDRVDKDPKSDVYEIIDYKTAKRMPSQDMINSDLQLSIYHLGLAKKWPHIKPENIKLSLYFLKHNEKIETQRTLSDLEKTKERVLKIINEIDTLVKDEKEFIPTPSALCDWCGYQKMCPMWKHLYAKETIKLEENEVKNLIKEYFELKDINSQNNKRIKAISGSVYDFMDQEGVERVFGENGYLTRTSQQRTSFNNPEMKKALETLGKWDEAKFIKKTKFSSLKASKKKPGKK